MSQIFTTPEYNLFPPVPRRRTVLDLPPHIVGSMTIRLYILGALAWDYADTVLNIMAVLRPEGTKELCRTVRQLRLDYDRFRQYSVDDKHVAREAELAMEFEEISAPLFKSLNDSLAAETAPLNLVPDHALLVIAVQTALTVLDAMVLYPADCDKWLRSQGVCGHSILDDRFRRLAFVLPKFAGDSYIPRSESRARAARNIVCGIRAVELCPGTDTEVP